MGRKRIERAGSLIPANRNRILGCLNIIRHFQEKHPNSGILAIQNDVFHIPVIFIDKNLMEMRINNMVPQA